jgi:hypothetical protein
VLGREAVANGHDGQGGMVGVVLQHVVLVGLALENPAATVDLRVRKGKDD